MYAFVFALLAVALAAQAAPSSPIHARSPYAVKEVHYVPREWTKIGRADRASIVRLHIGLKQGNMDRLIRDLLEISDPDHERYGNHLSAEQANELVRPTKETCEAVDEWLRDNGVEAVDYSLAGDWITVHIPIGFAERLLDTEYHNYKHENGLVIARTTSWSLPRHLHDQIDTIQPTTSFLRGAANAATWVSIPVQIPEGYTEPSDSAIAKACNVTSVTPECFATLYKTKGYTPIALNDNSIGFTNYHGEFPVRPDVELFLEKYAPEVISSAKTFQQHSINDGPIQDGALTLDQATKGLSHEANLDLQVIAGISMKTPIVSYSTGGSAVQIPDLSTPENTNEPYLDWTRWLLRQDRMPSVISTSYGEPEQTVPQSYALRVCNDFGMAAVRGTTLFFSSGDSGLGATDKCRSNDGNNTYKFLPSFPASCPFVTVVGATMNFEPEVAAYRPAGDVSGKPHDHYSSGSGFSEYFRRPDFQDDAVLPYLKNLNGMYDGLYAKDGRAYPDLAAQGLYFAYFWNGTEGTISGTSASSPLTAGIFALINDARIASGRPTLGYLNPWLYKTGHKGLNDVTKGFSYGCNVQGFPATEGWDPVTGFGTPNFLELLKLAKAG